MDRGRRPADFLYVVTQGTFLIEQLGNYLIADIETLMAKYIWTWTSVGAAHGRPSDVDLRNKPGIDRTSMIIARHPCW